MNRTVVQAVVVVLFFATLGGAFYGISSLLHEGDVVAKDFVNLQQGQKPYAGFRRAHAKGLCVDGVFKPSGELANYSRSVFFDPSTDYAFEGRFSVAGNNPTAPDLNAPVRSLALSLTSAGGDVWRMAMNTPPYMAVKTPDDFFAQLSALTSGDKDKVRAFFESHPESKAFLDWKRSYQSTSSFASEVYHSINAFYLVDERGGNHAVRWCLEPRDLGDYARNSYSGVDVLHEELADKLKAGPVTFDWFFTFAGEGDDPSDPTQVWRGNGTIINAGTFVITEASSQQGGSCNSINFDPLLLPDGVKPSEDPILRARSAAYAESYRRRAKETFVQDYLVKSEGE